MPHHAPARAGERAELHLGGHCADPQAPELDTRMMSEWDIQSSFLTDEELRGRSLLLDTYSEAPPLRWSGRQRVVHFLFTFYLWRCISPLFLLFLSFTDKTLISGILYPINQSFTLFTRLEDIFSFMEKHFKDLVCSFL